ncbi:glycosyltransferase family 4 protein [Candidatus Peregrinibacteria bacterium]|nr:glycosyltransferase family 4 protein [Candidatus Peregrinibacteria bacterium]
MKVGIQGRFLCEPYTGIGQYTENLLNAMAKKNKKIDWLIVVPKKIPKQVQLPKKARVLVIPENEKLPSASLRKFHWEQVQAPRAFKKEKVDVVHYPYPANPRFPGRNAPKTIVTVHDVIPWVRPESRRRFRTRLYQRHAKKALEKVRHIICVSRTTAIALSDHIKFPYQRIQVIHESASPIFKKTTRKFKSENPFFIYVGGYDKRKNTLRLIEAFQEYIAPKYDVDLVLVGAKNHQNKHYSELSRLQKCLKHSKIKDPLQEKQGKVILTPHLSAEKLAQYYNSCLGFTNVSLAEGFNIPLLEAASSGAPIITSDIAIHREIVGKNGLFCNPLSTKNIGETLVSFIRDKELQKSLNKASQALNKQYSWEKAATETLELYG